MSTVTATTTPPAIEVRVPSRTVVGELRAIKIVWEREVVRFASDRLRMITALIQPLLFLFVLGTGLSRLASQGTGGLNLRTFLYPGILAMSVLFTAMFSAASIVWDREFGFLREMLVAPIRRSSIVIGKCLGGATVATFQGALVICLAGLVGVPYAPMLILEVFAMQTLLAYTLTAFGVMVAARIRQIQSFMALTQMLVMPLFFVSGAMFPVSGLPTWLTVLNRVDPLTYAVDPIRRVVFQHLRLTPAVRARLDPGVTWNGWHVPPLACAGVVAVLGTVLTAIAIAEFSRSD
jgi:ABC-2 type transport system permease protein